MVHVLLYLPNLIGYLRVCLILIGYILQGDWLFYLLIVSALLDVIDGWLARLLNQESSFGAWLDVIIDLFTRAILWCLAYPTFGFFIFGFEFMVFTCTHSVGQVWQDDIKVDLHWYAVMTITKGFKTTYGCLAIIGLWMLPFWCYATTNELWIVPSEKYSWYPFIVLLLCRLHCFIVELFVLKRHLTMLLIQSNKEKKL